MRDSVQWLGDVEEHLGEGLQAVESAVLAAMERDETAMAASLEGIERDMRRLWVRVHRLRET